MATLSEVLRGEIVRVSKKANRETLQALQQSATKHRKQLAEMNRQLQAAHREIAQLRREFSKVSSTATSEAKPAENVRFQARGLKSLRTRLSLSAEDLGKLVGVGGQTIYNWEAGKSVPKGESLGRLVEIRGLGKREARAKLEKLSAK